MQGIIASSTYVGMIASSTWFANGVFSDLQGFAGWIIGTILGMAFIFFIIWLPVHLLFFRRKD